MSPLGTRVTDGCEPPCGDWESNSGPLQRQPVLVIAEPSLQPQKSLFYLTEAEGSSSKDPHDCVLAI